MDKLRELQWPARKKRTPRDAALQQINACLHWGGEVGDQTEERNREISAGIASDCSKARKAAEAAIKRYPSDSELAEAILELSDLGHFDPTPAQKRKLCSLSLPAFQREYQQNKFENPFVRINCPDEARSLYGK